MPYVEDVNNEKKYIPSKYAKEELPTWNEIYNEFYKEKMCLYDPLNELHQTGDLYWNVPHRKILLGWVCNQFNKMLFEDGAKVSIIEYINAHMKDTYPSGIKDIYFTLLEPDLMESQYSYIDLPVIYTCEIPSTGKRSIFASDLPSKNIKEFNSLIQLCMITVDNNGSDCDINDMRDSEECMGEYWHIISVLLKDIILYFEGDFVGWKDENGKPLTGDAADIKPGCGYQSGVDAGV